jgi:hypothetical protein
MADGWMMATASDVNLANSESDFGIDKESVEEISDSYDGLYLSDNDMAVEL